MKKIKNIVLLIMTFTLCMTMNVYAQEVDWNSLPGHHNKSVLLDSSEVLSKDIIQYNARGEILAQGSIEIGNREDGTIYISVDTSAHRNVDHIYHTVFLDQWDEKRQDWDQVDYFEFEASKDENDNLHVLLNSFIVSGHPINKYYRVRGIHVVELGDEMEGCATETNGVLITKR